MKSTYRFSVRLSMVFILFLLSNNIFATPVISSVTVTNISCGTDGRLVVNATGNGTLYYALIAPSQVTTVTQTNNIFDNLPSGSYTVAVYDADQPNTPVTVVKTISGSYNALNIVSANASTYLPSGSSQYCVYTGRVTVTISGGKPTYTYELLNSGGAVIATQGPLSATSVNFDGLSTGSYKVRVKDCGSTITTGSIAVASSNADFKSVAFSSVSGVLKSVSASCASLYVSLSSMTLNGSLNLANYLGVRYRIVYNGVAGTWNSIYSGQTANGFGASAENFTISGPRVFYIEVEHPCTSAVTRSAAISFTINASQLPFLYTSPKFNPCTGVMDSIKYYVTPSSGDFYSCSPYTVNMTIAGKTHEFTGTSPYLPANTPYTINWAKDGTGSNVTIISGGRTLGYTISGLYSNSLLAPYSLYVPYDCDPSKGRVVFKPNLFIPANVIDPNNWYWLGTTSGLTYDIQYKIKLTAGPNFASYPEQTITVSSTDYLYDSREYSIWDNLTAGNYTALITISGAKSCSFTRNFTFAPGLKAITQTPPARAGSCGAYTITGKVALTKSNSSIDNQTYYEMRIYKSNGSLLSSTGGTSNSTVTYSGSGLIAGNYTVKYMIGNCETVGYPITIPVYTPLDINSILSGGISCPPTNTADLTVVAVNGEGTVNYRIKEQGQADSYFSGWQASNKFTAKTKGKYYTVEIKDNCGSIQRNILIQDGAQQFLTVIGPVAPGVVCKGFPVTFGAYSIGQIISYQWYKNNVLIVGATSIDYTVPAADNTTVGTYKVQIKTGGGCILENSYTINTVSDPTAPPVIVGLTKTCFSGYPITLEASSTVVSGTYKWYKNGSLVNTSTSKYYTITTTGSYTVLVIPDGGCASAQSTPFVVSIGTPNTPVLSGNSEVCFGNRTTLTASPALSGVTYQWFKNGTLLSQTASNSISVSVNTGEVYTVKVSPYSGCVSLASNSITMTAYFQLTSGTISTNQTICNGAAPAELTGTLATGGTGTYTYQWEQSTNGTTWINALGTSNNQNYSPGTLTVTTSYRRKATDICGTVQSNTVTITVYTQKNSGTISANQTICNGAAPAGLTGTLATGGTGTYTYQWEQSTDGTTWVNAAGTSNNQNYSPGTLTVTTSYRRNATDICGTVQSNMITVTVYTQLTSGTISANQTICKKTAPASLTGTLATGGTGTYAYQWEQSTDGTTWINASGISNTSSYSPGALTTATSYRRKTINTCGTVISNTVTVNILKTVERYQDIRIQACLNTSVYLNGYLDTTNFVKVEWIKGTSSPNIGLTTGIINSFTKRGTYMYKYAIENTCHKDTARAYIKVLGNFVQHTNFVAVCKEIPESQRINLNQIFGLEAGGTVKSITTVDAYLSHIVPPSMFDGAYYFNANGAWGDGTYPYVTYNGDSQSKKFEFEYYPLLGSCIGDNPVKLTIMVTVRLIP